MKHSSKEIVWQKGRSVSLYQACVIFNGKSPHKGEATGGVFPI
jgi:hypothetical protein